MVLRIVIVGVPGVGKSTVVQKAVESIPGSGVTVFGTEMFEAALKLGWVAHRDEMRKLRVERQRKLQKIAAAGDDQQNGPGDGYPNLYTAFLFVQVIPQP